MKAKFTLKTQDFMLLVLLPSLLLVTAIMASSIYVDLYRVILSGFDQKLFAISTTTGVFIDGEDHDRLLAARSIGGLAFDPTEKTLYGVDRTYGMMLRIDPLSGEAVEFGSGGLSATEDLAFDPFARRLYGVDAVHNQLFWFDPQTGGRFTIGPVGMACHGLAFDPATRALYGSGSALIRIDPATGQGTAVGALGGADVRSLAFDVETGTLYGADRGDRLVAIDPATGALRSIGALVRYSGVTPDSVSVLPVPVSGLAFVPQTQTLYGAATRLVAIDIGTGAVSEVGNPGYRSEQSPRYLRYVEPMRRIKARFNPEETTAPQTRDLWFLYSQVLGDAGGSMTYVLDGENPESVDFEEMHAPLGFTETTSTGAVPLEAAKGAGEVMVYQTVYIGQVDYWENWKTQLKSAYAPIFDQSGTVRGMAGADVNVDRIDHKTRQALQISLGTGIFSLLLAAVVSFYITGRLIKPIRQLKEGALKIAAGEYGQRLAIQNLQELEELSMAFDDLSQVLKENIQDVAQANRQLTAKRCQQELGARLAQDADEDRPRSAVVCGRFAGEAGALDSSGWTGFAGTCLLWLAESPADSLQAARLRREISIVAGNLLRAFSVDWDILSAKIGNLFTDSVSCFAFLCPNSSRVHFIVRRPLSVGLMGADRVVRLYRLSEDECLRLSAGQVVLISSADSGQFSGTAENLQAVLGGEQGRLDSLLAQVGQAVEQLPYQESLAGRAFAAMEGKEALECG